MYTKRFDVSQTTSVALRAPAPGLAVEFLSDKQCQVTSSFAAVLEDPHSKGARGGRLNHGARGRKMPKPVYRGRAYLILTHQPSKRARSLTSTQPRYAGSRPIPIAALQAGG